MRCGPYNDTLREHGRSRGCSEKDKSLWKRSGSFHKAENRCFGSASASPALRPCSRYDGRAGIRRTEIHARYDAEGKSSSRRGGERRS